MALAGRHVIATALAAVALGVGLASGVSAQYFGKNKVQYKNLQFNVLQTEHFDIYFYPSERAAIDISARLAERWYARLARVLEHELRGRQALVLYASHADFEQTNVVQDELTEGVGGFTEPVRRRIVLPLGGSLVDTDHVIGHELVHAFQFDMTANPADLWGRSRLDQLPLWFIEGMAEYLSIGPVDANTAMWLRDAARPTDGSDMLPSIDQLEKPTYFPYRWGHAFWAYVGGRFGDGVIRQMLGIAASAGDVDVAIEKVLGVKTKDLSDDWLGAIRRACAPVLASATPPGDVGRLVVKGTTLGGDLNVGPAISPDGRWIAFLSQRSFFSVELYVADAATGEVVRKLTSMASRAHDSSIQFIYSAGSWDAASRQIAIAAVARGRPALVVFDAHSGDRVREIPISGVDEVLNPTWAPDGHAVGFTGMSQGLADLFVYDLHTSRLQRLTNDAYADLQPAWSPDGRRIAFVTDRFSSDLPSLHMGPYRLALVDPDSGTIEPVATFARGKNINPQWAPDGAALYFISDRDGIPNVYRVTLASGDVAQLTTIETGVSGITASSPALSVSTGLGAAAFCVLHGGKYDIFALDVAGRGDPPTPLTEDAAVLPPADRKASQAGALLADATFGLPEPRAHEVSEYTPRLSLEAVGQPTVAIGVDRFGAAFGGSLSLYFGDMLGNHTLATAVQFSSGLTGGFSLKDTAAQAGYFNRTRRWNWGVVGGQVPYLSGGFASGIGTVEGEPAAIDQMIVFRQTERSASGIAAYPFDRARRLEFMSGVTQISFDQIVETTAYSLITGRALLDTREETSLGDRLTLGTSAVAFVSDTANFGATSPVQGHRYRLEAAPTFGTLNFTSLLGDYRQYVMPAPFYTIAARVLHYGRYGSGGEDGRLYPVYLGNPTLVRGYDVNSFDSSDCVATAESQCPAFDRLLGSRVLVGNLEFRFPLLRPFGVSRKMYGPLPVEVGLFADAGVAWTSGDRPSFAGGTRKGVASTGVTIRANMMGFAVGQFDFVRPLQRPGKGWVFQFNLSPGF